MNICLVSMQYPPEPNCGGIGIYTYNLAHGLTKLGYNVHVISRTSEAEKEYKDKKVRVHKIKSKAIRGLWRLDRYIPVDVILHSIRVAEKINELIAKYKIEIVEFPNWYAEGFWFTFFKRNIPTVIRLSTPYFIFSAIEKKTSLRDRINCWLEKQSVINADIIIATTLRYWGLIAKKYKIQKNTVRIVPHGTKLPKLLQNRKKSKKLNVLFVGRLEKRKGIEPLLKTVPDILNEYPNTIFTFIGKDKNNNYEKSFRAMCGSKYLDNVKFSGYVSNEGLKRYYKQTDILAVPSLSESFGLIYLEAMAYGKPVIGCEAGGTPEVIENNKTGFVVSPGDSADLSIAIKRLLKNNKLRKEMGQRGRKRVEAYFHVERMVKDTINAYKRIYSNV